MKQIKSQDLRIGILVLNRDNEVMRVDFIGRRNIRQADHFVFNGGSSVRWTSEDIDYIKPIPLTEEWLFRLGFGKKEKTDVFENIKMKYWAKDAVLLFFNEPNNDGSFLSGFGSYLRISSSVPGGYAEYFAQTFKWIKYVHQLQNLYFALTGEELTLKSETTHETN